MLLPKKQETITPVTTNDVVWNQLAADPTVTDIPAGTPYGMAPPMTRETYSAQQDQAEMLKSSGGAMHAQSATLIPTDDRFGRWINSRWRPLMAISYLVTCVCDFVLFPIAWSALQLAGDGQITSSWAPLTIQGGGLYHIALGAILGVAAYGRSQEKLADKA